MNYRVFNKWVFNYYRSTTQKNGFCSLAIDEYEIAIFKRKHSLKNLFFREINIEPWSKLLLQYDYDGLILPKYFGLIALQCLAASAMENSEVISAGNFSKRFCGIIGIKNKELIGFFSETIENRPIQELIWERAKNYLKENLEFNLNIPNKIEGPGRYIQFPKSQVILNKEDLKEIAEKVLLNMHLECTIPEIEFNKKFFKEFLAQTFFSKNNKSKHELTTREIFLKQVFNYYNSNEWNYLKNKKSKSERRKKTNYFIEFDLNDNIHFYENTTEVHQLYEIFKEGNIYIFEKVAGSVEFELSNLFSINTELVLVSTSQIEIGAEMIHNHFDLNIVRCHFTNEKNVPKFLKNKIRKIHEEVPVYLKGVRLGHTWNYIQNFGPEIIGENYSILFMDLEYPNEQSIIEDYNSLECQPGLYNVRIAGFTSLQFVVLNQKDITYIDDLDNGLRLKSFTIEKDGILLKGIQLSGYSEAATNKKMKINDWVKAFTDRDFSSANNFLKSIKYLHYD